MATTIPPSSNDEAISKQELCLSFEEAIKTLPIFLQPGDEQERNELARFISQVNELHKPIIGKLSASSVMNYLKHMLEPATSTTEGPSQATYTKQMQEFTGNIAFEIARSITSSDDDLHNTTISVLNVLREVSWETKAALTVATFVLTFGDKGLNLYGESKVCINEIQMFFEDKGGCKQHMESNDNLFALVFQLIDSIVEFENLPITFMTSKDLEVKVARTYLIVTVYWIIRITVGAATTNIKKLSNRGNEFDNTVLAYPELPSRWSKNLKDLNDSAHLKNVFSKLQGFLEKDVDIETYNRIKEIIEQGDHSDNMVVLNSLFPSVAQDAHLLYDCLRKRKVHLEQLKGAYTLLFISGSENIAPEVDETELNEFIDGFDPKSNKEVECNIVWMPIMDRDRSVQHEEATKKSMVKPFLDMCYIVHQKLNQVVEYRHYYGKPKNLKGWYSVADPLEICNEVKKLIRDDWKYKKGESMIVVLDPQGNVVNHNAIHMFYIWSIHAFPFTSERQEKLWDGKHFNDAFTTIKYALPQLAILHSRDIILYYGGENMEWIRNLTGMMHEIEGELGKRIIMVYVGRSDNLEQVRRVNEENISNYCLSDHLYLWLFWTRIKSLLYSGTQAQIFYKEKYKYRFEQNERLIRRFQMLLNYDLSNVGWVWMTSLDYNPMLHGKVVLSTLKEFKLWKKNVSNKGFLPAFISHHDELYQRIFTFQQCQFPTAALKAPIDTMLCPHCQSHMQQYTTFICYHS